MKHFDQIEIHKTYNVNHNMFPGELHYVEAFI